MKTLKNYESFSEEYRLNENFLTRAFSSVIEFFKKKFNVHAWYHYMLYLVKTQQMPKNFEFYVPNAKGAVSSEELETYLEEGDLEESFKITRGSMYKLNEGKLNEASVDLKSNTMENVSAKKLKEIILQSYEMNKDRVDEGEDRDMTDAIFIWGAPGIGKTSILKQAAKELDCALETWHLASTDPTDFRGVPTIENVGNTGRKEDERTVTKIPAVFPTSNCPNGRGGILFFDELNQAAQRILSAALPLILEGEIGQYKLPDMWIIIAAGNREEDLFGGGTEFEPPMANRFAHFNYAPDLEEDWIPWAVKSKYINPDIIGFLLFKKEYFHMLDPQKATKAWPSPRTWEKASRVDYFERRGKWDKKMSKNQVIEIYAPRVGREAATAFAAYLDLKDQYNEKDVKDVYTIGPKAKRLPKQLDQSFAAIGSIAGYKKGQPLTEKELKNLLDFAASYFVGAESNRALEQITPLISRLKDMHPEVKQDAKLQKLYWEFVKKWHMKLKEEGVD